MQGSKGHALPRWKVFLYLLFLKVKFFTGCTCWELFCVGRWPFWRSPVFEAVQVCNSIFMQKWSLNCFISDKLPLFSLYFFTSLATAWLFSTILWDFLNMHRVGTTSLFYHSRQILAFCLLYLTAKQLRMKTLFQHEFCCSLWLLQVSPSR